MHVEKILLGKYTELAEAYTESHGGAYPNHVILYTWLSPCEDCTKHIIDAFQRLPATMTKSVVYSANYYLSGYSPEDNECARQQLREAGISVRHVKVEAPRAVL